MVLFLYAGVGLGGLVLAVAFAWKEKTKPYFDIGGLLWQQRMNLLNQFTIRKLRGSISWFPCVTIPDWLSIFIDLMQKVDSLLCYPLPGITSSYRA
jgi:hypothetical protein